MESLAFLILAASPDCFCTGSRGERHELGQTACLVVNGRAFEARCAMSLNNPTWRATGRGCVSAGSSGGGEAGQDALHPGAVDAHVVDPEAQA